MKITRKEERKRLDEWKLACELVKVIRRFFPDLLPYFPDPRYQSYVRYPSSVLLMIRLISSLCYISSMRKTREEFNLEIVIQNIRDICEEENIEGELPYWETINLVEYREEREVAYKKGKERNGKSENSSGF